jgi:hypothetical protein
MRKGVSSFRPKAAMRNFTTTAAPGFVMPATGDVREGWPEGPGM